MVEHRPSDRDVNWRPPVLGQSSPGQVKDLYTGSILMHVVILQTCHGVHLPTLKSFKNAKVVIQLYFHTSSSSIFMKFDTHKH